MKETRKNIDVQLHATFIYGDSPYKAMKLLQSVCMDLHWTELLASRNF